MPRASAGDLPDVGSLSEGALALLALAVGAFDDTLQRRRTDLLGSAALRYTYDIIEALPDAAAQYARGASTDLLQWMDVREPPPNLFCLCGLLADGVQRRIVGRHTSLRAAPGDVTTGFDHSVYLALGQSLARAIGIADGVGPDFGVVVRRAAALDVNDLQRRFVQNYLGNVMQDYFDASQVRLQHPNLPESTELELRTRDARFASDAVFAELPARGAVSWPALHGALKRFFGAVVLAERALDD